MTDEAPTMWTGEVSAGSFGPLGIGMQRDAMRDLFRGRIRSVSVWRRPDLERDHFLESGVLVTFDSNDASTFVELATPSRPSVMGTSLLERPIDDVIADLAEKGRQVACTEPGVCYVISRSDVGLYTEDGLVKAVSFGDSEQA